MGQKFLYGVIMNIANMELKTIIKKMPSASMVKANIRQVNHEAEHECQLWSDKKMLNRLSFTERPEIPKIQPRKKEKLSEVVMYAMRQFKV